VNLIRWRLERGLGYRWTHSLALKNTRGVPPYHTTRKEALDRSRGQQALDLGLDLGPSVGYRYEPPSERPT
jgi:hypothetical protein